MEKIVLEIELPKFNTEGIREAADEYAEEYGDLVGTPSLEMAIEDAMHLQRNEVSITLFVAPGEKCMDHEWTVHPMLGYIVGARLSG